LFDPYWISVFIARPLRLGARFNNSGGTGREAFIWRSPTQNMGTITTPTPTPTTNHRTAPMTNYQKTSIFLALSLFAFKSHAVSFNCEQASTLVEKAICPERELSGLDDLLMQSYQQAAANSSDKKTLKTTQLAWLKMRNQCQDVDCLKKAYEKRIASLDANLAHDQKGSNIVLGRCHMNSCWWWKVEKTETIRAERKDKLVKAYVKTTSADYSETEVERDGYPGLPPAQAQWGGAAEVFLFCSKKLPTYIEYNQDNGQFTGTVPFDPSGATSGATEGIGNLYLYVCHSDKKPVFEIDPKLELSEIVLKNPKDIFNFSGRQ